MFSSFAQFLPSAIQNISSHIPPPVAPDTEELPPPQSNFDPSTDDEGDEEELIRQQSQQLEEQEQQGDKRKIKSKKEKDPTKLASETFIFVRPPPSKTNHPLNLQVQLVPPSARAPSGVSVPGSEPTTPRSASSVSTDGASLARTTSTRSDYSAHYASNSTTSFASMASGESGVSSATSSSTRSARRIIPLYNLQAHNVLTNVIVDAGTDAKIAKFQKKGLELIDLAVLEPVEVWGVKNRTGEKEARKQGMKISVDEAGGIVHPGTLNVGNKGNVRSGMGLLLPKSQRAEELLHSATPSANSSALSLNSDSTHFSHHPQLVISPPSQLNSPPASAPPQSGTFPPLSLRPQAPAATPPPKAPRLPSSVVEGNTASPQEPPSDTSSSQNTPTPSKKSTGAGGLFGKLKFNTKRSSVLAPLSSSPGTPNTTANSYIVHPPCPDRPNEFTEFTMAPLAPEDVRPRLVHHPTAQSNAKAAATLSPPTSPSSGSSPNSSTPTPTATTPNPRHPSDGLGEEEVSSPTPTISPPKLGFLSTLASNAPSPLPPNSESPAQGKSQGFGGALSRGRNRFINGIKTAAAAPLTERGTPSPGPSSSSFPSAAAQPQTPTQAGGAKGFFNKLAAGISGGAERSQSNVVSNRGLVVGRESGVSRESVDSATSSSRNPFGRLLHHSGSQQFIGKGPSASANTSANPSPRPSNEIVLTHPTALAASSNLPATPASPFQGFLPQQQQQGVGSGQSLQLHQLSLRQLQLRPPVLGIQPTYVSASQSYANHHQHDISSLSLTGGEGMSSTNVSVHSGSGGGNGAPLSKVESHNSFGWDTEASGEYAAASSTSRRSKGRRESLNIDKESSVGASWTPNTALAPSSSQSKEKERALMYVWLVGRWLKKRGTGVKMGEHGQSVSEAGSMGRGARDLFQNILPGRDKSGGGVSGVVASEKEMKRGSWHAGAGIGLIPSLGALAGGSSHTQHASSPSYSQEGQPYTLGPLVGGGFEVRFEWKRAKTRSSKAKNKEGKEDGAEGGSSKRGRKKDKGKGRVNTVPGVKERDMLSQGIEVDNDDTPRITQGPMAETSRKMTSSERKRLNRTSTPSVSSFGGDQESPSPSDSPSRRSSTASTRKNRLSLLLKRGKDDGEDENRNSGGTDDDEDEESDSEDSETPWVCTLKIRRVTHVQQQQPGGSTTGLAVLTIVDPESAKGQGEKDQILRLKVGTLSPTPHHPKVVAMLKVPFPLPDVEVERMEVVKKKELFNQNSSGEQEQQQREREKEKEPYYGLTLTAEDIKDVVCSTGLWLVVREGFGGVGKVRRQGDGWKIRG